MRPTFAAIIIAVGLIAPAFSALADPAADKAAALKALTDVLPGPLIADPTALDWSIYGANQTHKVIKSANIPGGGAAVQFIVSKTGATYEVSANVPLTAAVSRGQKLVIGFYARTISAETPDGKGLVNVRFQQNAAPYLGFGDSQQSIGKTWQFYQVPATASIDLAKGLGIAVFQLASAKQTIEIGQTIIISGASQILKTADSVAMAPPPLMPPQLQGKGPLLNDPADRNWAAYGLAGPGLPIKAGIPGGTATRYTVAAAGAQIWDAGAAVPITSVIAEGDTVLLSFVARTISSSAADGKGRITISVQQRTTPYAGFGSHEVPVGANWGLVQIRTRATMALPSGSAQVMLHLAGVRQVLEIGPVFVQKLPPAP